MGKKMIILCIDIDETLMNSKTQPRSLVDFNGSNHYDDSSAWTNFIKDMRQFCHRRSFELLVQIISGKQNALPDDTVDLVMAHLGEFLPVVDKNGKPLSLMNTETQYIVRRYVENHHQIDILCDLGEVANATIPWDTRALLPPIHLCFNNKPGDVVLSKAWVMKSIKEHFNEEIPAKNIILIDNNLGNLKEAATGSGGTTPCFQVVSAASLEKNIGSSFQDKKFRTRACTKVLNQCRELIIKRVREILKEEAALELKQAPQPCPPIRFPVLPPPASRRRLGLTFEMAALNASPIPCHGNFFQEAALELKQAPQPCPPIRFPVLPPPASRRRLGLTFEMAALNASRLPCHGNFFQEAAKNADQSDAKDVP